MTLKATVPFIFIHSASVEDYMMYEDSFSSLFKEIIRGQLKYGLSQSHADPLGAELFHYVDDSAVTDNNSPVCLCQAEAANVAPPHVTSGPSFKSCFPSRPSVPV